VSEGRWFFGKLPTTNPDLRQSRVWWLVQAFVAVGFSVRIASGGSLWTQLVLAVVVLGLALDLCSRVGVWRRA
jgi:hypothetical protein